MATRKTKSNKQEEPQLEDLIDGGTEDADAVKAALAEAVPHEEATPQEESTPQPQPQRQEEQGNFSATYSTGASEDDMKPENDPMEHLAVRIPVRVDNIPITELDKRIYLKAMLADTPVELEIQMQNGFTFVVRSLSTYEENVVTAAGLWNYKDQAEMSLAEGLGLGAVKQYRVSMQIVSINGNPVPYKHFLFEHGKSDLNEDAKALRQFSDEKLMNTQGPLYGLYLRAIEVFLRKMKVMQDAAYSLNFWQPESGV